MIETGNIFADIPARSSAEHFMPLLARPNIRIERIVSQGHASAPDFWYDQSETEWVILLQGTAEILFEGESAPRPFAVGDYVCIPAHVRHRVTATDAATATVWLAVHAA